MNKLDQELKKLKERGAVGVSLTLKPGTVDEAKCAKEMIKFLRAMKKCKECEGIEGNGRGAWGYCTTCQCRTWPKGTYARDKHDKEESFKGSAGDSKFSKTSLNDMRNAGKAAGKALKNI